MTWRDRPVRPTVGFRSIAGTCGWPSLPGLSPAGRCPMTTAAPSTALVTIQPAFTYAERLALAGSLAGYRGLTREAYALDLRQFATWCRARSLALFAPAAAGRTTIPNQPDRSCTRSPAAADPARSSPGGGRGRCRPPGRWSSSASGRRSASPNPGPASTRSSSSTRPGAASDYGRKTKADVIDGPAHLRARRLGQAQAPLLLRRVDALHVPDLAAPPDLPTHRLTQRPPTGHAGRARPGKPKICLISHLADLHSYLWSPDGATRPAW